jgi:mRNA interferase MazF
MKQFDVYTVSGGVYSAKPRPSFIIQSIGFDELDSVTIIPMTTVKLESEFRIAIEPSSTNGLESISYAMIDKLTTVRKSNLGSRIGEIDECYIDEIETGIVRFIGLASAINPE